MKQHTYQQFNMYIFSFFIFLYVQTNILGLLDGFELWTDPGLLLPLLTQSLTDRFLSEVSYIAYITQKYERAAQLRAQAYQ